MKPLSQLELTDSPKPGAAAAVDPAGMADLVSLRAEFLNSDGVPEGVRPVVVESWHRSRTLGIDPELLEPQQPDAVRLAATLEENRALVAAAGAVLEEVHAKMGEGPHVVALSDATGFILRLLADAESARNPAVAAANLFEGASWNERHIGCNGIGTCLAAKKPVVLIGAEHFQNAYLGWTCIGVPLKNAAGEIVGALDFSVPNRCVESETWGWVLAVARTIEANLAGATSGRVNVPPTAWGRSFASVAGVMELLVTQLKLPATHARFIDDVRRAMEVAAVEHERAEQKVHESEQHFRILAEATPQLVWILTPDGTLEYHNSRSKLYDGIRESSGVASWQGWLHPDDAGRSLAAWQAAAAAAGPLEIEHRVRMADGAFRWHLTRAHASRTADGKILKWFGTSTDIDEQKRAQENLEKKVQERTLLLCETIAELEHFSYTITHDMRAPLRAMQAFGQILQEDYSARLDAAGRDYLRRVTEAAARMDGLIVDALDYSKAVRSEMPLEAVDAGPLIRGIVESYPQLQLPRADIEVAEIPPVLGNRTGLLQCMSNLLTNAVKFVEPGTIPRVRVWSEERGQMVRLVVGDNGVGIPPEQHERVFGMFQRLSKRYEGTGIGLALVRKVVQRMNGRVGCESEVGKGSRFWIELARAPGTASQQG